MEYYVPLNGRCRNKSQEFYKLLRPHKKCVSFQSGLCLLCRPNKRPSEDVKRHFVAHYPTTNKLFFACPAAWEIKIELCSKFYGRKVSLEVEETHTYNFLTNIIVSPKEPWSSG